MRHFPFFSLFFILFAACEDAPPPPPKPLDITGTWEIVGYEMDPQKVSEPAKALALLEFGSKWTFEDKGAIKMELPKKSGEILPHLAYYTWRPADKKLDIIGNYYFYYDITYHTNDSLAVYNRETNITYELKRISFGKPTHPIDSTLLPPPLDSTLIPNFGGKYKMQYIQNERIPYATVLKMNRIAGEQIWVFEPSGRFTLGIKGNVARGQWVYLREFQKLQLYIGGKQQVYRVVSLAQKAFTLESAESGNKLVFNKMK